MRECPPKFQVVSLPRNGLPACHHHSPLKSQMLQHRKQGKPPERVATLSTALTSPTKHTRKRLPNASASALWGFNVYHSPELDQEELDQLQRRRLLHEKLQLERERIMQLNASTAEQKRVAQRLDYTKYLYYASKYGPLNALLYCCTDYPGTAATCSLPICCTVAGRVYELLVQRTARVLQHWATHCMSELKCHARFHVSRATVAMILDTAVATRLAVHTQHHHAHKLRMRIFYRVQYRVFSAWRTETERGKLITLKFKRAMASTVASRFATWKDLVATRNMVRQGKLCQASVKVFQRALYNRFWHWKNTVEKTKLVRARFTQVCSRRTGDCWQRWRNFAVFAGACKPQATTVQRVWKGHRVRVHLHRRNCAATKIQARVRGILARGYTARLRERMQTAEVKLRFHLRKDMVHRHEAVLNEARAAIDAENSRHALELQAIHCAREVAKRDATDALSKLLGNAYRAILKEKIAVLKAEWGMDSKRATAKATQEVIEEAEATASDRERLAFRQLHGMPPAMCPRCLTGLPHPTCPHACGESAAERMQRQTQWIRDMLHDQAMALAALDTRPISYAERYRVLAKTNET
ncbi:hypothetical protein, variant 2 [Aphanomyces invadans]|uniref:Uncharacterized protein n=1 Tax=Aphanomyces invadans TaxID=157072 RepID=A0A024TFQ2_9STRA|nr:hypothetical protein, variant 2 [Aphanomyces invadans]ETV92975.1 hypothetical protein, variant 2 [Aphanomyces invadans]|eukprot:XP_008878501.1 hypothetical protein, variant 2 [Aphanomyces invadans]